MESSSRLESANPEPIHYQKLIEDHLDLVRSMAQSIHRRLPAYIRFDDVLSYGHLGLTQAARSYQPFPGSTFSTYAYYRIQGAIFDGVTRMNWSTRSAYREAKRRQMANEVLDDQNAQEPAATVEGLTNWMVDTTSQLAMVYLSTPLNESQSVGDLVVDQSTTDPSELAETGELTSRLRHLIAELPSSEKKLIELTYFEGKSLAEAAVELNKSRSWACRMHAKVLKKMAHQLNAS
jgi:RNA polymerase sigma factor for flagellar operon FliA